MGANGKRLIEENRDKPRLAGSTGLSGNSLISVSFKYFKRDLENFEVGNQRDSWFISILDRLTEYTGKTIEEFRNGGDMKSLRLHKVDWEKSALKRTDFKWLPESIVKDAENFPFRQIEISLGKGRIIFFMNDNVAFILLFDPNHNMQLCKKHNYKIRSTWPGLSEIDVLKSGITKLRKKKCDDKVCPLDQLELSDEDVMVSIDRDLVSTYNKMVKDGTLIEAFEEFLLNEYAKPQS